MGGAGGGGILRRRSTLSCGRANPGTRPFTAPKKAFAAAFQTAAFIVTDKPGLVTGSNLAKLDAGLVFTSQSFYQFPKIHPALTGKIENNSLPAEQMLGLDYLHIQTQFVGKLLATLRLGNRRYFKMFLLPYIFMCGKADKAPPRSQGKFFIALGKIGLHLLRRRPKIPAAVIKRTDKLAQFKTSIRFDNHMRLAFGDMRFIVLKPAQNTHSSISNQHQFTIFLPFGLNIFVLCHESCHSENSL